MSLFTEDEILGNYDICVKNYSYDRAREKVLREEETEELKEYFTINENNTFGSIEEIDVSQLRELINTKFFNIHIMEQVSSIINYINKYSYEEYPEDMYIRYKLNNLQIVSTSSREANVIKSGLKTYITNSISDLFIIKSPKDNKSIIHDLFVGLIAVNGLRSVIPNFVYTFGRFYCSSAIIIDNSVESFCNPSRNNTLNVIYENIIGQSFGQLCYTINLDKFLNYYLQILYALQIAGNKINFTHNDLHAYNILLRPTKDKEFSIPYQNGTNLVYLTTDCVATIIDYGFSHIKVNNKDYGEFGYIYFNYDAFYPIGDAYHLLIAVMFNMRNNNNVVYKELSTLLNFFVTPSDLDDFLNSNWRYNSYLPYKEQFANKLDDLIEYIQIQYPIVNTFLSKEAKAPIMSCDAQYLQNEERCLSDDEIKSKIVVDIVKYDIYYLYYLLINGYGISDEFINENRDAIIDIINNTDNILIKLVDSIERRFAILSTYNDLMNDLISDQIDASMINQSMTDKLYYYLKELIDFYQVLNDAIMFWAMIVKVSKVINDDDDDNVSTILDDNYDKYASYFNKVLDYLPTISKLYSDDYITILLNEISNNIDYLPSSFEKLQILEEYNKI